MRGFKKVWAEFDPERTGYLQPRDVSRFCRVSPACTLLVLLSVLILSTCSV